MDRIIDAHGHLGDILEPEGGALIGKIGVPKARDDDLAAISERRLHAGSVVLAKIFYRLLSRWVTAAERARNATATLENFANSLEEAGIAHAVALPVPPYVTFDDLARAAAKEPRVVPFTGVDYTRGGDPGPALDAAVTAGARGLKLHPIIQNIPLTSPQTYAAVEAFARHDLPILFHCGISTYYLGKERRREQPRYGAIRDATALVRDFPRVRFIAGHAGLFEVRGAMKQLGGLPNVWVDTSFQSAATVRELIVTFGPDKVLFASDWPFGERPPAVEIAKRACRGDRGLERRIFSENAAELLGLH